MNQIQKTSHVAINSSGNELRVPAVAGFVAAIFYASAYTLFSKISDALDPGAIDHGLIQLAAHPTLTLVCQQMFAVADIAMIVFLFGLASVVQAPFRSPAWLGSFLYGLSFALDVLVVGSVVATTTLIAPRAALDPAMHAAGIATLGFASVLDFREGFLWMSGSIVLGATAWRGKYWPRWLAGMAILNGVLATPYLPNFFSTVLGNITFTIWVVGMSVILWRSKPAAHR
jgi:hypothetical protein